jgi:hypothetical protein
MINAYNIHEMCVHKWPFDVQYLSVAGWPPVTRRSAVEFVTFDLEK